MKVCHYYGWESLVNGGIDISIRQQRKAMEMVGIDYTEDPEDDYDILHLNTVTPAAVTQLVKAKRNDVPVVFHAHTTADDFRDSFKLSNLLYPLVGYYVYSLYERADRVVTPSPYARTYLDNRGISTPMAVISNGVDPDRLDGVGLRRRQARERFDVTGDVVFAVSSVMRRKGLETFIEVARQFPETEFVWFGAIPNTYMLEREANRLIDRSPDNVRFTGYVDDIRDAYAAGDIFLYPTREETQGLPAVEAAYCHRPIILRDIPAFDHDFTHERNCLKATTTDEFGECVQRLLDDPCLRERLGDNAQQMAQRHTLEEVGVQLRDTYESLVGQKVVS